MNPRDADGAVRYHERRHRRPLPVVLAGAALVAVLLWAQTAAWDAGEGTAVAAPTTTPTEDAQADATSAPGTSPAAGTSAQPTAVVLLVEVRFDVGSDAPSAGADALLDDVAAAVLTDDGLVVRITGHAEPSSDVDLERELSRQRALRVVDLLVARGVPSGRAEVVAAGADQAEGRSPEDNRRVVLEVLDR